MSKLGVGVGEDFPVDDSAPAQEEGGCCRDRHEAFRQWREQKRQWHRMRHEWRARKAAMREQFRREVLGDGLAPDERHHRQMHHIVLGALALIGLAALFSAHRDH